MKTTTQLKHRLPLLALLTGLALLGSALHAAAASPTPPERMAYQGFLVDANGAALSPDTPGNYPVVFRIYDASTGGNILWSEQQVVTVDKGNFSVVLGEGTDVSGESRPALSTVFIGATASDRYLGITVTISGTAKTLAPRLRWLPSPYAFTATKAMSIDAQGTSRLSDNRLYLSTGSDVNNGLGYSTTFGGATIGGPALFGASGGVLGTVANGTTEKATLFWNSSGNVGIGTASPEKPLTVIKDFTGTTWANMFTANPLNAQLMLGDETQRTYLAAYYLSGQGSAGVIQASDYFSSADHFNNLLLNPNGGKVGIGTTTPANTLDVNGGISSTKWKITDVINGNTTVSGGVRNVVVASGSFSSGGGTLSIFVSASGFATAGETSLNQLEVLFDDVSIGFLQHWFNVASTHLSFVPKTFIKTGVAPGNHTIKIKNTGSGGAFGVVVDANDRFQVVVTEYPF